MQPISHYWQECQYGTYFTVSDQLDDDIKNECRGLLLEWMMGALPMAFYSRYDIEFIFKNADHMRLGYEPRATAGIKLMARLRSGIKPFNHAVGVAIEHDMIINYKLPVFSHILESLESKIRSWIIYHRFDERRKRQWKD